MLIKHRPNNNPKPKRQTRIHAKNPPNLALAVPPQLVARDVRLERAQRVHHPQRREQRAHRPEDDQPRLQPAFGVEVLVFAEGEGVRALGGGGGGGGEDGGADDAFFGVVEGELGAGVGVGDAAAGF